MLYEGKISYKKLDDYGKEITVKESFVIEDCETFTEAETALHEEFGYFSDFDVTDLKRSRIKEIANTRSDDNELLFMAEVKDTFTTDEGVEKEIKYKILFFSVNIDSALSFITEYMEQGYDMSLIGLKRTKFIDVL